MKNRNFVLAIIFTLLTCGIYGIYWMIQLNNDINTLAGETDAASGGKVFLFTLLTCGIYGIFWMWKMGERVDKINGKENGSSHIMFLILGLIGLGIVNYCIMQDTINKRLTNV